MPKNTKLKKSLAEYLSLRPDEPHIARTISTDIYRIYNQSASPKKVSKLITQIRDTHPQIQLIPHTPSECGIYGCRYSYSFDTTSNYGLMLTSS
jgi:hypothetical protein